MTSPARARTSRFAQIKALLLFAALLSFLLSVGLFFLAEHRAQGIFVGLWVPSILSLGALLLVGEQKRSPSEYSSRPGAWGS